jgi:hypothetical protein
MREVDFKSFTIPYFWGPALRTWVYVIRPAISFPVNDNHLFAHTQYGVNPTERIYCGNVSY